MKRLNLSADKQLLQMFLVETPSSRAGGRTGRLGDERVALIG